MIIDGIKRIRYNYLKSTLFIKKTDDTEIEIQFSENDYKKMIQSGDVSKRKKYV